MDLAVDPVSERLVGRHLFVILYAGTFVFLCALLFPDSLQEYRGFEDYFISRRRWFFGLLATTFVLDVIDTRLKGLDYLQALGSQYLLRNTVYAGVSIIAMFVTNRRFHAIFVAGALVYLIVWFVVRY
jgi:hypothetical protein